MFGSGGGLKIATIRGIPVFLDYSWLFIAALVFIGEWQQRSMLGADGVAFALAIVFLALFFLMIFLHELAHAVVARRYDIPVTSITLVFWGGFTKLEEESEKPSQQAWISAAGPISSLAFALVLLGIAQLGIGGDLDATLRQVGVWSLFVAGLNALPGYPLDGGQVLRAIVWGVSGRKATGTKVAGIIGQVFAVGFRGSGVLQFTRENTFGGILFLFVGFSMFTASRQAPGAERVRDSLSGGTVADAMGAPPTAIPADISLIDALQLHLRGQQDATFPVIDTSARLVGIVTLASASALGQDEPLRPVRDAMLPLDGFKTVEAAMPLDQAARFLGQGGSALVLRDGALAGLITLTDIARWAERRDRSEPPGLPDPSERVGPSG